MNFQDYKACIEALPYGKRLPNAVYIHWPQSPTQPSLNSQPSTLNSPLNALLAQLIQHHQIPPHFNLLKLRTDEPKLSLFCRAF